VDDISYLQTIDDRMTEIDKINIEVKDIIFDYFNIISKQYEMSYEKWKDDEDYIG